MTTDDRLKRWQDTTEWPLAAGALLFLAAYAWPILQPGLDDGWRTGCFTVAAAIWGLFIADYVIRLTLAPQRRRWFWRHLLDLAVLGLPFLRPLQLLRLVMLFRVLNRRAVDTLHGRIAAYVTTATVLLTFVGALAVLDAERGHPGANITDFGRALWWAATTITTVGYGDQFPVTGEGRFVAVLLMIGGVALLGTVTASLASWLVDRVDAADDEVDAATRADVATLLEEVRELKAMLAARSSTG
jgi:voltage-gated potassium channel